MRRIGYQSMIVVSPVGNSTRWLTPPIKYTLLAHTTLFLRLPTLRPDHRRPGVPIPAHLRFNHFLIPSPTIRKRILHRHRIRHPRSIVFPYRNGSRRSHLLFPLDQSRRRPSTIFSLRRLNNRLIRRPIPTTILFAPFFVAPG